MSQLQKITRREGAVERAPAGLPERLVWLTRFGKPRLSHLENGWYAWIQMHVSSQGASFEVKSEFGIATPDAAVDQLIERLLDTLARFNGGQE